MTFYILFNASHYMPQSGMHCIYTEKLTVICLGQHLIIQDRCGIAGKMQLTYLTA